MFDDPLRGICCPAILVLNTFYINPNENIEQTLVKTLNKPYRTLREKKRMKMKIVEYLWGVARMLHGNGRGKG